MGNQVGMLTLAGDYDILMVASTSDHNKKLYIINTVSKDKVVTTKFKVSYTGYSGRTFESLEGAILFYNSL